MAFVGPLSLQAAPTGPLAACEMLSTNASAPSQCPDTPLFNRAYECIYNTKCLTGGEVAGIQTALPQTGVSFGQDQPRSGD